MEEDAIRRLVLATLESALPGVDPGRVRGDEPLRAQVDLDSMDWLNVLTTLGERLALRIPEQDYGRLRTLDDMVRYLAERRHPDSGTP